MAIGQISLCIPDLSSTLSPRSRPWLARLVSYTLLASKWSHLMLRKVSRQRMDHEKKCMVEDVLIYYLDRRELRSLYSWLCHASQETRTSGMLPCRSREVHSRAFCRRTCDTLRRSGRRCLHPYSSSQSSKHRPRLRKVHSRGAFLRHSLGS